MNICIRSCFFQLETRRVFSDTRMNKGNNRRKVQRFVAHLHEKMLQLKYPTSCAGGFLNLHITLPAHYRKRSSVSALTTRSAE